MKYKIHGAKLRQLLYYQGLNLRSVSHYLGFNTMYLERCIKLNELSKVAILRIYDKYHINPALYVLDWKGEQNA